MKKKVVFIILIIIAIGIIWFSGVNRYLTFECLKENRAFLGRFVNQHYVASVLGFISLYIAVAFFLPGAIIMTLAAGFLYGTGMGAVYVNLGTTLGATLAFLASRYLMGNWVQHRFEEQLQTFNKQFKKLGHHYLLTLRVIPLIPFFLVNLLAGLTRIRLRTFIWTTSLGVLPGSLVYTFFGEELGRINAIEDLFSWKLTAAFLLLALFFSFPIFKDHIKSLRNSS
jgi:uncharacterized membrane protein YdjX (TVP38/TMEM64 family)